MTFINIRYPVPYKLYIAEVHDAPKLVSGQAGAYNILRLDIQESVFLNIVSMRHLA